jgi:hypothetical protein
MTRRDLAMALYEAAPPTLSTHRVDQLIEAGVERHPTDYDAACRDVLAVFRGLSG